MYRPDQYGRKYPVPRKALPAQPLPSEPRLMYISSSSEAFKDCRTLLCGEAWIKYIDWTNNSSWVWIISLFWADLILISNEPWSNFVDVLDSVNSFIEKLPSFKGGIGLNVVLLWNEGSVLRQQTKSAIAWKPEQTQSFFPFLYLKSMPHTAMVTRQHNRKHSCVFQIFLLQFIFSLPRLAGRDSKYPKNNRSSHSLYPYQER